MNTIYYVMGVSGSGKSTIGELLAQELEIPFYDGDDYHPKANIEKMAAGDPLNDDDRKGWLSILNKLAYDNLNTGAVIVCSALKQTYRNTLTQNIEQNARFIYLKGSYDKIWERLSSRKDHFMPSSLLKSQFDILEEPAQAIVVSILDAPKEIIANILK